MSSCKVLIISFPAEYEGIKENGVIIVQWETCCNPAWIEEEEEEEKKREIAPFYLYVFRNKRKWKTQLQMLVLVSTINLNCILHKTNLKFVFVVKDTENYANQIVFFSRKNIKMQKS